MKYLNSFQEVAIDVEPFPWEESNGHLRSSPPALPQIKHLDQSTVKAKPPEAKPPEAMWGLVHQLGAGNDNIFAYQNVLVAKIKIFAQTVNSE